MVNKKLTKKNKLNVWTLTDTCWYLLWPPDRDPVAKVSSLGWEWGKTKESKFGIERGRGCRKSEGLRREAL